MQNMIRIAGIAGLLTLAGAQADELLIVGNAPSYFQGQYGTQTTIRIAHDVSHFQYQNERTTLKLSAPYLSVQGLPVQARIVGGFVAMGNTKLTRNVSGWGDLSVEGNYVLQVAEGGRPAIAPYGKIKFGTASQADGLGTGKNDYEAGLIFQQMSHPDLSPFASIGYQWVGNPAGYALRDIWIYKLGLSWSLAEASQLTAMLAGGSTPQSGQAGQADLMLAWSYRTAIKGMGFQAFLDKGLTNSSSTFGAGFAVQYAF